MKTAEIKIQNLKCDGCAHTITTKLSGLNFVEHIKVNTNDHTVTFSYKDKETLNLVKELLIKLGYPEIGDENKFTTKAKSFASCAIGRINR